MQAALGRPGGLGLKHVFHISLLLILLPRKRKIFQISGEKISIYILNKIVLCKKEAIELLLKVTPETTMMQLQPAAQLGLEVYAMLY